MLKIDKGIFYYNNQLYSQSAYYLSQGFLNPNSKVSLEYLFNINFDDSTNINKLINSFEYMSTNNYKFRLKIFVFFTFFLLIEGFFYYYSHKLSYFCFNEFAFSNDCKTNYSIFDLLKKYKLSNKKI